MFDSKKVWREEILEDTPIWFSGRRIEISRMDIAFENGIPGTLETETEGLYQNLFSCFARFRVYGNPERIHVFAVRDEQKILSVLAYFRLGKHIIVLNEQIELCDWEVNNFAQYMFSNHKELATIDFKAIRTNEQRLKFPYHSLHFTNDIVLPLPASEHEYENMLGKSTRENIRRSLKLLKRDLPDFSYLVGEKEAASRIIFHEIIELNRARMARKDKVSGIGKDEEDRLWRLVSTHGFVASIVIGRKVRAGTIFYRVGSNYFLRVIAHDSAFDEYSLGLLACYLTICECIDRGGKEFHFLWGNEDYKRRLRGESRDFDSIRIFRSNFAFLLNILPIALSIFLKHFREAKIWALNPANRDHVLSKCALHFRKIFRAIRRQVVAARS